MRPTSEDALLFEAALACAPCPERAERLGVTIAIENLAPVFPGPEPLSATPMVLRELVSRIGSQRVGICLDLGHAHIVAERRRTSIEAPDRARARRGRRSSTSTTTWAPAGITATPRAASTLCDWISTCRPAGGRFRGGGSAPPSPLTGLR